MRKTLRILAVSLFTIIALSSCSAIKETRQTNALLALNNTKIKVIPQQNFSDLQRGLETNVIPVQPANEISGSIYHLSGKSFFIAPTIQYVRTMGLIEKSPNTDYKLFIKINQADIDVSIYQTTLSLQVSLQDETGKEVFSQNNVCGTSRINYLGDASISKAYAKALEQINWNRIVSFLRVEQLLKDEPYKQVQGDGNTALEQTIVRWDVQSRPQGADIFWRVVSKTPDVKSTNNKYLMTTPYEATKALDIRGLSYQTSGNVRIILRCEKDGYLPQEKEFDVRMVLDQEEISAFFRLVKENE